MMRIDTRGERRYIRETALLEEQPTLDPEPTESERLDEGFGIIFGAYDDDESVSSRAISVRTKR